MRTQVRRTVELWTLFRNERNDPGAFYRRLASDAVDGFARRHGVLRGRWIADIGCGPGYYTDAFRAAGAHVLPVEYDPEELRLAGTPPLGAVVGDAERLPAPDGAFDGVFCSNMLEHTPRPAAVIAEMARVLRPGGWGYLSFTNWYSPWGGHEMNPYHLLGPARGVRLFEQRHGPDHKHKVGENLYPTHIGATLRQFAAHPDLRVERVEPRYYPWAAPVMKVPGVREVLAWNCVIRFVRA
ncbi:MAG: class I SAM-dependent methyltransferase [Actinomycetota bacterium]